MEWCQLPRNYRDYNTINYFFLGSLARSFGFAIVNHNHNAEEKPKPYYPLSGTAGRNQSLNRLKIFIATYRYLYRSNEPQSFMAVVVTFNSYFLFPVLGEGVHEVRGSKQ